MSITETGQYVRRTIAVIERIFNGPNIQKCLVSKKLEWAGRIRRDKDSLTRQVLVSKLNQTRPGGIPRQRCLDRVKFKWMRWLVLRMQTMETDGGFWWMQQRVLMACRS